MVTNHLRPFTNPAPSYPPFPLAPLPPSLHPLPSLFHSTATAHFNRHHHFLKKEKTSRVLVDSFEQLCKSDRRWSFYYSNVGEVLHQIVLEFIKLPRLKTNTLWLVWCHYGVHHIIVLGCVSVKLSMDLLAQAKTWQRSDSSQLKVRNLDLQPCCLFCLASDFYCFLEVWGLFGPINFVLFIAKYMHQLRKHFSWCLIFIHPSFTVFPSLPLPPLSLCMYGAWKVVDRDWLTRAHACCGSEG